MGILQNSESCTTPGGHKINYFLLSIDDDQSGGMDPDMMAMMGFGGFGGSKKN